jgi:hypothetical protein
MIRIFFNKMMKLLSFIYYLVEQMWSVVMGVVGKLLEQIDAKHYLLFLLDINEQTVLVVVGDLTEMVAFVVALVVERSNDDDKLGFENMHDDDGHYYCRQLKVVGPEWIMYPVDKAN